MKKNMFRLDWLQFDRHDMLKQKSKDFATEEQIAKFIEKLEQKNNFYKVLGTGYYID